MSRPDEQRFRERIEALGGRILGEYVNARTPVDCVCSKGHSCKPVPANIHQGHEMCRICAGKLPNRCNIAGHHRGCPGH